MLIHVGIALLLVTTVTGLDNGVALTPPMGFLSWERFGCNTECDSDPDVCIGERMLMLQANAMVSEGYKDVRYEYITVDDCWPAEERDSEGKLQADPRRFPHGMKALARYMHSKGLKLGIYEDIGTHTCQGFPGTQDTYELDAKTFAEWEIDMLKFDGCNSDHAHYEYGYPAMGKFLNETGRPILYSCEWAIYDRAKGQQPNYTKIAETCNSFRVSLDILDRYQDVHKIITWYGDDPGNFSAVNGPGNWCDADMPNYTRVAETCNSFRVYGDIYDAYQSDMSVINWYGDDPGNFSAVNGPGNWCDGDMITLGNFGLSPDQERIQMGMWSMFSSPLLMSVDLRNVGPQSKALLQNRRVLAINQDSLGVQAKRIMNLYNGKMSLWTKPITPSGSFAFVVLNSYEQGYPRKFSFNLTDAGLTHSEGYNFTEVFDGNFIGNFKPSQNFTCTTNPPGIYLVLATPLQGEDHSKKSNKGLKLKDVDGFKEDVEKNSKNMFGSLKFEKLKYKNGALKMMQKL